ncbi:hypothetical protein ACSBR2_037157 [Camellia fascicularis]
MDQASVEFALQNDGQRALADDGQRAFVEGIFYLASKEVSNQESSKDCIHVLDYGAIAICTSLGKVFNRA